MDARKILQKINLILEIEDTYNLQNSFSNIFSYYTSNDPQSLESEKERIPEVIENSEINNFVNSDLRILEGIGIRGYFDMEAIEYLEKMLEAPGYEAQNQLSEFVNERAQLLELIRQLKSSLEALEVKEDQTQEVYQFVLSLPGKYRDLNELENFIKDIKVVLQTLNSKDPNASPPKIASVNNGSVEFFIEVAPSLAEHLTSVLDHLLKIYATKKMFEEGRKWYGGFTKKRKDEMDKIANEQLDEKKDRILNELVEKLAAKNPEEKTRLKKCILELVKHLENGVQAEIKTPEIEEPEEISNEDDTATKRQKREDQKRFEQKQAIDTLNKKLFLAQKEGLDLRLLNPPKEDEEKE